MGSFFEPQRKIDNKIWATRNARRPVIAKRTISVKKRRPRGRVGKVAVFQRS